MKNNLKGTEKQVKWAEDIREKMIVDFEHLKKEGEILKVWNTLPLNPKKLTEEEITKSYEELINSKEDAKWFIENKQTWIIELVHEKELLNYVKEILDLEMFNDTEANTDAVYDAIEDYMYELLETKEEDEIEDIEEIAFEERYLQVIAKYLETK